MSSGLRSASRRSASARSSSSNSTGASSASSRRSRSCARIIFARRRLDPFGVDLGPAQHRFDPLAARIGDDEHRRALLARAAGAARAVLQRLGIARDLDMDDQADARQVDAARGHVGRHADPGAAVAQRLQRLVAFLLRMLARQRDHGEPALLQRGVQSGALVARGAEQDRGLGFVEAQQVDHRVLDLGRRDGDRLIGDVAVAALVARRLDAQRVALVAFGER
jgi:hypothetical protein